MIIALPPSEGKTASATPKPVDSSKLAFPALAPERAEIAAALRLLCTGSDAATILKVGPKSIADLAWNRDLDGGAPAREIYTGVLFEAADLRPDDRNGSVWIFSGLFGVVKPEDVIAPYRLPAGTALPGVGVVSTYWRHRLAEHLDEVAVSAGILVDCRSGPYQRMWSVPKDVERIEVRVVRETGGRRKTVSHMAKHYRGLLTRALLDSKNVTTARQVLQTAQRIDALDAELTDAPDGATLTMILRG